MFIVLKPFEREKLQSLYFDLDILENRRAWVLKELTCLLKHHLLHKNTMCAFFAIPGERVPISKSSPQLKMLLNI